MGQASRNRSLGVGAFLAGRGDHLSRRAQRQDGPLPINGAFAPGNSIGLGASEVGVGRVSFRSFAHEPLDDPRCLDPGARVVRPGPGDAKGSRPESLGRFGGGAPWFFALSVSSAPLDPFAAFKLGRAGFLELVLVSFEPGRVWRRGGQWRAVELGHPGGRTIKNIFYGMARSFLVGLGRR